MVKEEHTSQLELFPNLEAKTKRDLTSTFADNMTLPIHKWFRYTAGFSALWVREMIKKHKAKNVLDPFGGSGTVMLESEFAGINSIGIESHPYIYRIANAKLSWKTKPSEFRNSARKLLEEARKKRIVQTEFSDLITKCYPKETLIKLEALKQAWLESNDNKKIKELNWFVITSILRVTSPVGTAQWQYVLPNKSKRTVIDPFIAFETKTFEMVQDITLMQKRYPEPTNAYNYQEDARNMQSVKNNWADLVITSPPYANNYDYADATRLEMSFWGEINGWGDLQDKVRKNLITACTQHVSHFKEQKNEMLNSELLSPIQPELNEIFYRLGEIRLNKGGKKNYHLMILAYFYDMAEVFKELRRTTTSSATVCFVIGDSAPYGIYVPVDKWLGKLAVSSGFGSYNFEKTRDRNIKWKNRKHRVPLHEGRLWIKG